MPSTPPARTNFKCFIKFNDNKFDIVLEDAHDDTKTFHDIFEKMVDVFRWALKKDLLSNNFIYEFTDSGVDRTTLLPAADQKVPHQSVIVVRERPMALSRGRAFVNDADIQFLEHKTRDFIAYYLMVDSMANHFRSTCFTNKATTVHRWSALHSQLVTHYPNIFWHYKATQCSIVFQRLTRFYLKVFDKLNLKIEAKLQKRLDMLKIVHLLDPPKIIKGVEKVKAIRAIVQENQEIQDYIYLQNKHSFDMYLNAHRMFRQSITFDEFAAKYIDNEPKSDTATPAVTTSSATATREPTLIAIE